jgi:hypothetical protein
MLARIGSAGIFACVDQRECGILADLHFGAT